MYKTKHKYCGKWPSFPDKQKLTDCGGQQTTSQHQRLIPSRSISWCRSVLRSHRDPFPPRLKHMSRAHSCEIPRLLHNDDTLPYLRLNSKHLKWKYHQQIKQRAPNETRWRKAFIIGGVLRIDPRSCWCSSCSILVKWAVQFVYKKLIITGYKNSFKKWCYNCIAWHI